MESVTLKAGTRLPDGTVLSDDKEIHPTLGVQEEQTRYALATADASLASAQAELDELQAGADAEQVRAADRHLGALLDAWSRRRSYDESLIVFFSDHGEHLYEEGTLLYHGQTMADALLHVPLVVKYPAALGREPEATERPTSLVDLAPTVLDAVGEAPSPDAFDGALTLTEK